MKIFAAAVLAASAFGAAAPAHALNSTQETCVQRAASDRMHAEMADEMLGKSSSDQAIAAIMEVAFACAVSTDIAPQLHDAYVSFAVSNSLRESLYDQLSDLKYPVEMLGAALEHAIDSSGSPGKVFSTDTGLTDEGFELVTAYMERRGASLGPDDEGTLEIVAMYLTALANIVSMYDVLYEE